MQLLSVPICIAIPFFCMWSLQQHRHHGECSRAIPAWGLQDWIIRIAVASLAMSYVQKAFERLANSDPANLVDIWRDLSILCVVVARVWLSIKKESDPR